VLQSQSQEGQTAFEIAADHGFNDVIDAWETEALKRCSFADGGGDVREAAVEASRKYFSNVTPQNFVPVGERLTLPTIKKFLRSSDRHSAVKAVKTADVLELATAIVKAQAVLAAEIHPAVLVHVISTTRAVFRESFRMALGCIYREGSCGAFLERVETVTLKIAAAVNGSRPRQVCRDVESLYDHATSVEWRYGRLMAALAKRSGGKYHSTPLKVSASSSFTL
jgi:hypothetical protein